MHRVGLGLSLVEAHAPSVSLVGTVVGCLLGYACFKTTRVVFPIESVSFLHTSTTREQKSPLARMRTCASSSSSMSSFPTARSAPRRRIRTRGMRGFSRWRRHSNGERHPRRRRVGSDAAEQADADQGLQGQGGRSGQAARGDTPPWRQRCGRLGEVVRLRAQALGDGVRRLLAARRRRAAVRVHVRVEAVPRLELGELGNALQLPRGPDDVLARRLHGRRRGRAGVGAPRRARGLLGAAHALAGRRRVRRLRHAEGRVGAGGAGRVPHGIVVVLRCLRSIIGREVGSIKADGARVLVLVHDHADVLRRHPAHILATGERVVLGRRDRAHEGVDDSRGVVHGRVWNVAAPGNDLLDDIRAVEDVVTVVVDDALDGAVEEPDRAPSRVRPAVLVLLVGLENSSLHIRGLVLVVVPAVDDVAQRTERQRVESVLDERRMVPRIEEAAVVVRPHDVVAVGVDVVHAHRPHVPYETFEEVRIAVLRERDFLRHPHVRKPLDDGPQIEILGGVRVVDLQRHIERPRRDLHLTRGVAVEILHLEEFGDEIPAVLNARAIGVEAVEVRADARDQPL
eukprot:scaffold4613_cov129-Isochrysis_galbana.AAC.26